MAIPSASHPLPVQRPWQERRLARGAVALAAVLAASSVAVVMAANPVRTPTAAELVLVPAVGLAFSLSGLVATSLRPDNHTGPLIVATGFLWLAAALAWSQDPVVFSVGHLFRTAYLAGVIVILLAFPTGRLRTRAEALVTSVAIVAAGPAEVVYLALGGHATGTGCPGCPPFVFELVAVPALARSVQVVQESVALVGVALSLAILMQRWRSASPPLRFAIAPVLWTGTAMLVVFGGWVVNEALRAADSRAADLVLDVTLIALAASFIVGIARTRLARSGVADLVLELERGVTPEGIQAAMARALRDPSLRIAYFLPEQERFVDSEGNPVDAPAPDGRLTVTTISRDGHTVAALVHDAALDDEALVRSACAAAALALENGRLQADLKARLVEVQASRARIVEATQEERRRLERDLHDGAQQRLVATSMILGLALSKADRDPPEARTLIAEARESLSLAIDELRELSHGIHPALLTERGLGAALEDLAARSPLPVALDLRFDGRLPRVAESAAYFVASECVTNAAKHSGAERVTIRVTCERERVRVRVSDGGVGGANAAGGSGLRGLRDRVEALGGRLSVDSPRGRGTIVEADIPCA